MLALAGCANTVRPGEGAARAVDSELAALRASFVNAYARADADAVSGFYAADATYIGTAGDVVTGRDNLLIGLRREVPVFRGFSVEPVQFDVSGRLAYERGIYRASVQIPGRTAQPVAGPYLMVYERGRDGDWKIKLHMTARERPPVVREQPDSR